MSEIQSGYGTFDGGDISIIQEGVLSAIDQPIIEWDALQTLHIDGDITLSDRAKDALKKQLGYSDVIVRCEFCNNWAAVQTSCKHCGAPVG